MEIITSRSFALPESAEKLRQECWFNLWSRTHWPYRELVAGDVLYWYEASARRIVWKTRVARVDRFQYQDKAALQAKLEAVFHAPLDVSQAYFVRGPVQGYCLAYSVIPLDRLDLPKPDGLRFPELGWLRVDDEIARAWLGQATPVDDATLDDAAPKGSLLQVLQDLSQTMADVESRRVEALVRQTIRRDGRIVRMLKELCDYRCQFPGCGVRIPKRGGGYYVEVAHVLPVHRGGKSVLGNLVALCPNHHKEFDVGDLHITKQTIDELSGTLNGQEFTIRLPDVAKDSDAPRIT